MGGKERMGDDGERQERRGRGEEQKGVFGKRSTPPCHISLPVIKINLRE